MDAEDLQNLYESKYQKILGMSYLEWSEKGPQTEDEAFARLQEINDELENTYDDWYEALGPEKDHWEEYRDKLKAEYDFLEEAFGLELRDK